jgi:hypothetical protein
MTNTTGWVEGSVVVVVTGRVTEVKNFNVDGMTVVVVVVVAVVLLPVLLFVVVVVMCIPFQ